MLGPCCEVLAWNRLAAALIFEFASIPESERNLLRLLLLDERVRSRYVNIDEVVQRAVAQLRAVAVQHPDAAALTSLVGELSVKSELFRNAWARHDVAMNRFGTKQIRHPLVGVINLDYELLLPGDQNGPFVVIHTAKPGSSSHTALALLRVIADQDMSSPEGHPAQNNAENNADSVTESPHAALDDRSQDERNGC